MTSRNEVAIGQRVRDARLAAGLSQADLVSRLRSEGIVWQQTTVSRIELGTRPLLWSEGEALRVVIGFGESSNPQNARDAAAYARILRVIAETEGDAS